MKATQQAALRNALHSSERNATVTHSESLVITVCSLPVPITIPRPRSRYLSRVSFFSSRRRGRHPECYWVHMGYFSSRVEAQRWLRILHSDYPDAFIRDARSLVLHERVACAPAATRRARRADLLGTAAQGAQHPNCVRHRGRRDGVCR